MNSTTNNTRANHWFTSDVTFRQLCGDAQSQADSEKAQEFANEMVVKAKQYGLQMYLSANQLSYLCKLADWDIPKPITQGAPPYGTASRTV